VFLILLSGLIVADSNMAMVLPDDISSRLSDFVVGRRSFPFLEKDETACLMYLFGKRWGVADPDIEEASEVAKRTAGQMSVEIERYKNGSQALFESDYIRSKFLNRGLQLAVEKKLVGDRLVNDPVVLSECFAQHVAFYKQDYFFGLYGPLKVTELTNDIRPALLARMIMVCYNRRNEGDLGSHPLVPVYVWFKDRTR
jgi:hypothetical protein